MAHAAQPQPFAEVMQSSLHTFHAECWEWNNPPAFGELVYTSDNTHHVYAIVTNIVTRPRDHHRSPMPLQKTYEELKREHPHIFHLLHTRFTCVIIGYYVHNRFMYQAPPHPERLHAFVQSASSQDYKDIFSRETYLPLLFHAPELDASIDELILSIMRHIGYYRMLTKGRIERMIDTFSMLINNDYRRLKLLLQRIEQLRNSYSC